MKKTKIVCTLGPSSQTKEIISAMVTAGMNVARINFSHGTHEEHAKKIQTVKEVRDERKCALAIMLDTKGPEFRIRDFENGAIELKSGDIFRFTSKEILGNQTIVGVSLENIHEELAVGDKILLNNGLMSFKVTAVENEEVVTTVEIGGRLTNRKSMYFPDKELHNVFLSEQDKADLLFGIEQEVDFIALSFVSKAQDV
ncbi:MAG: pyruvate kinase, partial [Clostridia bacterium]|nr:pyruvate kinase [Clostridia bacterium]